MPTNQLQIPILDGGIKSINFFNGRLLSAEDLSLEKTANKQARQQLGQALGDGVAYGLEVQEATGKSTKQAPVVTVQAGLALNRLGQPLHLTADVDLALVRPTTSGTTTITALFADCQPPQQESYVVNKGVYLLTIQTAQGTDGKAPVSGLGNLDAACNAKYQIDGVQFRLIQLPITTAELNDTAHLRNHLAYRCFGVSDNAATSILANPFGSVVTRYGLLDELRSNCLKNDEVPLALIYWTLANGIEFVDMWSVRRRMIRRSTDSNWPLLASDRRTAEGEAMFLQFQEHIQHIRLNETNLESAVATKRFERLPPVGILPIARGTSHGFAYLQFFQGRTYHGPMFIEGARVEALIREALLYPAIDLNSPEMFWLYLIRENIQSKDKTPASSIQPYLIFVNGHVPYRGEARFDLNRWNYSNYI